MKRTVGEVCTREPITIDPSGSAPEARKLMQSNDIRRLPVVRDGRLVGIVTLLDLMGAAPSAATSLSVWELNYLLDKVKIEQIMTKNVRSVRLDTPVHEAAALMLAYKIGGLPVLDGDDVVGIITESDIFRLFVELSEAESA